MSILAKRKNEDISVINAIEKIFKDKRKYVFKIPKKKTPVILLLSGGMDSIISWAMLMDVYDLIVYPVFFRSSSLNAVEKIACLRPMKKFSKMYKKTYPDNYRNPKIFDFDTHPKNLLEKTSQQILKAPDFLLNQIDEYQAAVLEIPGLMNTLAFGALEYANFLQAKENIKIKDIFSSTLNNDGVVKSQSFTMMRTIMLNLCIASNDYSIQYSSIPMEKELGLSLMKEELILWGEKKNIPLKNTRSCDISWYMHCGCCISCMSRIDAFKKSNYKDKTLYWNQVSDITSLARKIVRSMKSIS